jgi:hypothetical protein
MNVGEIYFWKTDKAYGYDSRSKYHIYICAGDWREENTFLFISKSNYGNDLPLSKEHYDFFPLEISYISCSGIVCYSDEELAKANPELKGQLRETDMRALFNAIAGSESMEAAHIKRICEALKGAF